MAGWDLGRLSEAATAADDAILHVLSVAQIYGGVKIRDAQLTGRAEARQPTKQVAQLTDASKAIEIEDRVPERIAEPGAANPEFPDDLRAAGGPAGH